MNKGEWTVFAILCFGVLIGFCLGRIVGIRESMKLNEEWFQRSSKTIDQWSDICKRLNTEWTTHVSEMIERRREADATIVEHLARVVGSTPTTKRTERPS